MLLYFVTSEWLICTAILLYLVDFWLKIDFKVCNFVLTHNVHCPDLTPSLGFGVGGDDDNDDDKEQLTCDKMYYG